MQQPDALTHVRQLVMGFRNTQLLFVAAKLGIMDAIGSQTKTALEVAHDVGAAPDPLYRVMRALAALGLLVEHAGRRFAVSSMGQVLRSDAPGSMRNVALLYGDEWLWHAYGKMIHSARTGEPAFPVHHGRSFYDFLQSDAAAAAVFQLAMDSFSKTETSAVLAAYDFSGISSIVDVGCGSGALLAAVLKAHPEMRGIGFDLPAAQTECLRQFHDDGISDRAAFQGGDFFHNLPGGHELYMMKSVLHNWDDEAAHQILQVVRQAAVPPSRLLLLERVISEGQGSAEAKLFDINMLVTVGGRERTQTEYSAMLARAGFEFTRSIATTSPLTIVEASVRH